MSKVDTSNPDTVVIAWADGHESRWDARELRLFCACAHCNESRRRGEPIEPPEPLAVQDARLVGAYGISFTFSDGHHYGIYRWDYLRQACPCAECKR